jgi:hypothetical protein
MVALTFVFLLLDVEGDGNWALGITLVWFLVGVATLILLTRRRPARRSRPRRRAIYLETLEIRKMHAMQSRRIVEEKAPLKYLTERRD